jgi:2-polyprenyl-3-methyl-5-hydroxy-6-metoxy-1,4-benzoquinol methylase
MNFQHRSTHKEILDETDIPPSALRQNLSELDFINRYLGGHGLTLDSIEQLIPATPQDKPIEICEIGCGGGGNLQVIDQWARLKGINVSLTGIDLKTDCLKYAQEKNWYHPTRWIRGDFRDTHFHTQPDILFSSLFCHHFPDEEIPPMLHWMHSRSRLGFFINDLHRHPLAYYSIKALTKTFSRSYLVRNDAPLSVARSFHRRDWEKYFAHAGLLQPRIVWKWAFRWQIIHRNERL